MTLPAEQPRRVAILKPCCIGDCIMALPAIDALASAWGAATIDVFVGNHSRAAFSFRPILTARPIPDSLDFQTALQLSRQLRQGHYDAVISLDRSRWLRLAARLSRASLTGTPRSMVPDYRHESEVYLDVVRQIGIPTPTGRPSIVPTSGAIQQASDLLRDIRSPFAVFHPGGAQNPGVNMLDKRWPASRFIELARALRHDGVSVLLSGGSGDASVAHHVAEGAGIPDAEVLAGRIDIETLAAVLIRAAVYVGPDTGVSHVAAAIGVPTIAIFGPTNPRRYRPLGRDVQVLAPLESWQIADRDLRYQNAPDSGPSTEHVSVASVLHAARQAINRAAGNDRCSD